MVCDLKLFNSKHKWDMCLSAHITMVLKCKMFNKFQLVESSKPITMSRIRIKLFPQLHDETTRHEQETSYPSPHDKNGGTWNVVLRPFFRSENHIAHGPFAASFCPKSSGTSRFFFYNKRLTCFCFWAYNLDS